MAAKSELDKLRDAVEAARKAGMGVSVSVDSMDDEGVSVHEVL